MHQEIINILDDTSEVPLRSMPFFSTPCAPSMDHHGQTST
jgi:hypothetical protein